MIRETAGLEAGCAEFLAGRPKLCSTDREELKEYARTEWNGFERCSNPRCFGG